jgi:hypothetical protein
MKIYQVKSRNTQNEKVHGLFNDKKAAEDRLEVVKNDFKSYIHNQYKIAASPYEIQVSALIAAENLYKLINDRNKIEEIRIQIRKLNEEIAKLECLYKTIRDDQWYSIEELEVS